MSWSSLGTPIIPTTQWQLYDVPVIEVETFKVKSDWSIQPYWRMRAYLGQFFGTTTEVFGVRRIYPIKDTDQIIDLVIPEDFKKSGQTLRHIGIKLGIYSRLGSFAHDWQVALDGFSGSSPTASSGTTILPGQIPGLF